MALVVGYLLCKFPGLVSTLRVRPGRRQFLIVAGRRNFCKDFKVEYSHFEAISLYKKLVYCFILVFLTENPKLQLFCMALNQTIYLIVLKRVKPYKQPGRNMIRIMSETLMLIGLTAIMIYVVYFQSR